jgi:NAD-dependent SIR2 family protein deacetylase
LQQARLGFADLKIAFNPSPPPLSSANRDKASTCHNEKRKMKESKREVFIMTVLADDREEGAGSQSKR